MPGILKDHQSNVNAQANAPAPAGPKPLPGVAGEVGINEPTGVFDLLKQLKDAGPAIQEAGVGGRGELGRSFEMLSAMLLESPIFSQLLGDVGQGANAIREGVNTQLARSGVGRGSATTGVGALAQGAAQGASAFGAADARGQLLQLALQMAQGDTESRRRFIAAMEQAAAAEKANEGPGFGKSFLSALSFGAPDIISAFRK